MEIIDLPEEYEQLYFVCLEDWSDEMKDAGSHKERWYRKMKDKGLRVKLAKDDKGVVGGMIHYLPVEHSTAEGEGLYFINCIWVHGHKEGRGDFRGQGMGKALLRAAEEDAKGLGAKGMVAWGITLLPVFMRAKYFKRHGYKQVDKDGLIALMWKPFTPDAKPPRMVKERKRPEKVPGKVSVTAFVNGWCPSGSITTERARSVAAEFGDKVQFREIDTSEREVLLEWGISDGLFIDGKPFPPGPPLTKEKIRKAIEKRVRKI